MAYLVQFIGLLTEEAEQALLLLGVKALQLAHHVCNQVAHLSQVLGADIGESGVGEVRHFLLGTRAVLQNLGGILHIDLRGEIRYHFLLLNRQYRLGDFGLLL